MTDYAALWEDESREFLLACDASGVIVWLEGERVHTYFPGRNQSTAG